MEAARVSIAPGVAILLIGMVRVVIRMADEKTLMSYQATMRIARQWLSSGLITEGDYEKFDTIRYRNRNIHCFPGCYAGFLRYSRYAGHR